MERLPGRRGSERDAVSFAAGEDLSEHYRERRISHVKSFWITFVISEALSVVEAFIASSKLTDTQKAAAEKLVADGGGRHFSPHCDTLGSFL